MNVYWGRTRTGRSWHIVVEAMYDERNLTSRCGRAITQKTIVNDRPGNEKTCETCLRNIAPK